MFIKLNETNVFYAERTIVDLAGVEFFCFINYLEEIARVSDPVFVETIPNIGFVDNPQKAVIKATRLWKEIYPNIMQKKEIYDFKVLYNEKEDWWYIYGEVLSDTGGSFPNLVVKTSGEVLAIWTDYAW